MTRPRRVAIPLQVLGQAVRGKPCGTVATARRLGLTVRRVGSIVSTLEAFGYVSWGKGKGSFHLTAKGEQRLITVLP